MHMLGITDPGQAHGFRLCFHPPVKDGLAPNSLREGLAKVILAVCTFELFIPSQVIAIRCYRYRFGGASSDMAEGKYLPHAMVWSFPVQVPGLGTEAFIHHQTAEPACGIHVVRDVRGRLPAAPPPAVVGVLLPGGDGEDAAVLDAALRRHFPAPGTVHAARYSPGCPGECRAAACRALRAALQHPAEEGKDRERWRLPSFLRCISWKQRNWRKDHKAKAANNIHEDGLQDPEEEVALTSLSPNGNCEEAAGGTGT
ncbi:uncharacterized protein C2orf72 homolog [Neopelma chrysocephalum]|uniref:uncharacterized protein C2orf72 homolog n=1 Tax=Neopelma chrysocephalum TaxID=114329 RepID=UPI000FCD1BB4|nr:uncharacterized protein C2orf72 homolog [Neopelma chrysocephalum]